MIVALPAHDRLASVVACHAHHHYWSRPRSASALHLRVALKVSAHSLAGLSPSLGPPAGSLRCCWSPTAVSLVTRSPTRLLPGSPPRHPGSIQAGRRLPVERPNCCMNGQRKLGRMTGRNAKIVELYHYIAAALVVTRQITQRSASATGGTAPATK
jgi:hypothetical protein